MTVMALFARFSTPKKIPAPFDVRGRENGLQLWCIFLRRERELFDTETGSTSSAENVKLCDGGDAGSIGRRYHNRVFAFIVGAGRAGQNNVAAVESVVRGARVAAPAPRTVRSPAGGNGKGSEFHEWCSGTASSVALPPFAGSVLVATGPAPADSVSVAGCPLSRRAILRIRWRHRFIRG